MPIEQLEQRRMLALAVAGGLLTVNGTEGVDQYEITQVVSGATTTTIVSNLIAKTSESTTALVNKITVNLKGGDDYIRLGSLQNTNQVGASVPAKIFGGAGNDWIIGGRGDDSLAGELGNDKLEGKFGADTLDGGTGLDIADYSSRGDPLSFNLDGVANDGGTDTTLFGAAGEKDNVQTEVIYGGTGNDKLFGDTNANYFDGGGGIDSIVGSDGNDTLIGGTSSDTVQGGKGNDYLSIKEGYGDTASGDDGQDTGRVDQTTAGDPVNDVAGDVVATTLVAGPSSLVGSSSFHPGASSNLTLGGGPSFLLPGQFPSDLDPSFGPNENGKATYNIGFGPITLTDLAYQDVDGQTKLVGVGYGSADFSGTDFFVMRLNEDGTLDTSFGDDDPIDDLDLKLGYTFTNFPDQGFGEGDDYAFSVQIDQIDNSIVVGGYTHQITSSGHNDDYAIARYTTAGELDDSFSEDGMQTRDFPVSTGDGYGYGAGDISDDLGSDLVIVYRAEIDREYVLGGNIQFQSASVGRMHIVGFKTDGSVDTSFGADAPTFGSYEDLRGMAVNPDDNSVFVIGTVNNNNGQMAVVHYDKNGARLFENYSSFVIQPGTVDSVVVDTANHQLIVVGTDFSADGVHTEGVAYAIDYESDAFQPVTSTIFFGPTESGNYTSFNDVALDSADTAVMVGTTRDPEGNFDFIVARVITNGLLPDNNFADGSAYTTTNIRDYGDGYGSTDIAVTVAIQPDGKIVAGGQGDGLALARYVGGSNAVEDDGIVEKILDDDVNSDAELNLYQFKYFSDESNQEENLPPELVARLRPNLSPEGVLTLPTASDRDDLILVDQYIEQGQAVVRVNISFDTQTFLRSSFNVLVIDGAGGNDTFIVDPSVTVPVSLIGGVGNDIIQAGVNNDTVNAGAGLDIVIGGPGADTLLGEGDRDIIIGGLGADIINGGADDDILINGTTSYDNNFPALAGIMSEWGTTARNYATRIANINGTGRGTKNNGSFLFSTATVASDAFVDTMTGGVGGAPSNSDWFLARMFGTGRDILTDSSGEVITSI